MSNQAKLTKYSNYLPNIWIFICQTSLWKNINTKKVYVNGMK